MNRAPYREHDRRHHAVVLGLFWGVLACGVPPPIDSSPHVIEAHGLTLTASLGTYHDGSGRPGLALLATLREANGNAPVASFKLRLEDEAGEAVMEPITHPLSAPGQYVAIWLPEVGPALHQTYLLTATDEGGRTLRLPLSLQDATSLPSAELWIAQDGSFAEWAPISGAALYRCEVFDAEGGKVVATDVREPRCDLSELPAGAYFAEVLAFSADFEAIRNNTSAAPELPATFDVSVARVAFGQVTPEGMTLRVVAAGGGITYGPSTPGLAVLIDVRNADNSSSGASWDVEVVGPALPSSAPLRFTVGAGVGRHLVWAYDVPVAAGTYGFHARSAELTLSGRFSIADAAPLQPPSNVSVALASSGDARVSWTAAAGATSYFVSVWERSSSTLIAGKWVNALFGDFLGQTFNSGAVYDVYVAATSADMLGGAPPTSVAVAEDAYNPISFTAK